MRQPIHKKRTIRWCLLLFGLALFLLFTLLPPNDRRAYLAWVDSWERSGPAGSVPPPAEWPQSTAEHLAVLWASPLRVDPASGGTVLYFQPGSRRVVKDDVPVWMDHPVLLEEDTLLLPIEDVLTLLGGTVRVHRETGTFRIYLLLEQARWDGRGEDLDSQLPMMALDRRGISYGGPKGSFVRQPKGSPDLGEYPPRQLDGVIYLPAVYLEACFPATTVEGRWTQAQSSYRLMFFPNEEWGAGGVSLGQDFRDLSAGLARELGQVRGDLLNPVNSYIYNAYGNRDIRIECVKSFPPWTPEPATDKQIIGFTLLSPRYATPRGIHLGDSGERVRERYNLDHVPENGLLELGPDYSRLYIRLLENTVVSIEGKTPLS